jgi:death-on-curing protein
VTTLEPLFLTVEEVLAFHADQIRLFGGTDGIRLRASLESAVAVPQASFGGRYLHVDLFEMAAAYAFHIAENQPFVDGNKRTALNAALSFLGLNGQTVLDPEGKLYDAMIAISARQLDKKGLATLLCALSTSEHEEEQS